MVAVIVVGILAGIKNYCEIDDQIYDNELRLKLSDSVLEIEQGKYETLEYPYLVTDLSGKVLYASKELNVNKGEWVSTNEILQNNKEFIFTSEENYKIAFALTQAGKNNGYAAFFVPKSEVMHTSIIENIKRIFMPMSVALVIDIMFLIGRSIYVKKRVFHPISAISESANAIIKGDYEKEVVRVYENEIKANEVGNLIYSFELMRDELKEKRISEQKLKEAQQELISCISHDLRTPLATIKAYCEGLRDGIAQTEEEKEEYVKVILKKTNFLIDMIKDLLEYSNAQLNKLIMNYEEIYIKNFIEPLLKELQVYAGRKEVVLTYQVPEEDILLRIDQKRITEVLYNLVENSLKYIDKTEGEIHINVSRQGKELLISVKDNGAGISSEDIMYVFDKFYRSEKSRTSNVPGSGLGLSICKYIIEQHGGKIYCNSTPGQGAEVGFTLPI